METTRFLLTLPKTEKIILEKLAKSQSKKTAEYIRTIITDHLLKIGVITQQEACKTKQIRQGGDQWKQKIKNATPTELEEIRKKRSAHAKKMRAARTAKANNGGVANTGNISGTNVILGSGKVSQKNLPK